MTVQTRDSPAPHQVPNDPVSAPDAGPSSMSCMPSRRRSVAGPLAPAIARVGQRIVDTAFASAKAGLDTMALME